MTRLSHRSKRILTDHLVAAREQSRPNIEAKRLGGLEVDDQLELRDLAQVGAELLSRPLSSTRPSFPGRLAGPTLERVGERADFLVA